MMFEHATIFPHGIPIAADGFGNFWVVDISSNSSEFGPVWFACHDAPVILYQSPDLGTFLSELFKLAQPPYDGLVNEVHEDSICDVWGTNPGVVTYQECAQSQDPKLQVFASSLDDSFQFIDLRKAQPGDGFSWGRYGPETEIYRFGELAIFAYRPPQNKQRAILQNDQAKQKTKRGFLSRLFGG